MVAGEVHARFHIASAGIVVGAGFFFDLSRSDWLIVILTIALVISLEAVNTAVEAISDLVSPKPHPAIKLAKDVSAGAVLIAAIAALFVAILIFGPHIRSL